MEDHRKNQNAGDKKTENPDFEFGSFTPSSPSQDPYIQNSPADHFFFNGRLLPHAFPKNTVGRTISSRTASEDSSRSNSTNSRSSSSSSPNSLCTPRTSSSSYSNNSALTAGNDHKPSPEYSIPTMSRGKTVVTKHGEGYMWNYCKRQRKATEMVTAQLYGSYSQRWQYITGVPGAAFKRGCGGGIRVGSSKKAAARRRNTAEKRRGNRVVRWWRRLIRAVVLACRECHAMAPERLPKDDDDMDLQRNSNLIARHN